MALSFFRALNPTSKNSGIVYCLPPGKCTDYQGKEMIDYTITESIHNALRHLDGSCSALEEIFATIPILAEIYEVLIGRHYDLAVSGMMRYEPRGGVKGVLDYLIFPLIARKLIADTYLDERGKSHFSNAIAWCIAVPLELIRFTAAISLTLLLAPVVALVQLIKACLPKHNEENSHSAPGITA